jgi:hypothetical protein
MSAKVDLYNNAYGNYAAEVYREFASRLTATISARPVG